jgi:predicted ribosomally synthesized six-cysteine peptide SCIFF
MICAAGESILIAEHQMRWVAMAAAIKYNTHIKEAEGIAVKHIKTVAKGCLRDTDGRGCGQCQASCQSACKTSCTVGNQTCEKK